MCLSEGVTPIFGHYSLFLESKLTFDNFAKQQLNIIPFKLRTYNSFPCSLSPQRFDPFITGKGISTNVNFRTKHLFNNLAFSPGKGQQCLYVNKIISFFCLNIFV